MPFCDASPRALPSLMEHNQPPSKCREGPCRSLSNALSRREQRRPLAGAREPFPARERRSRSPVGSRAAVFRPKSMLRWA